MNENVVETPAGLLTLEANVQGLTRVRFGAFDIPFGGTAALLTQAERELAEYFAGRRRSFNVPLCPCGTPFRLRVWRELANIPYGGTVGYGELARRIGAPGAARAVGGANNANPLPIFIPCHRVIGVDGSLTGYAGGLDFKRYLLELEGKHVGI